MILWRNSLTCCFWYVQTRRQADDGRTLLCGSITLVVDDDSDMDIALEYVLRTAYYIYSSAFSSSTDIQNELTILSSFTWECVGIDLVWWGIIL